MECNQDNGRQQSDAAQAVSIASTPIVDTSPLSELPETYHLEVRSAEFRGESEPVGVHVNCGSAVADTDEDSVDVQSIDELPYGCDYCNKTFVDQKKLDRHLKDKRSRCVNSRLGHATSGSVYACPRCDAQMSKKYSAERHIKDSCWKVCDECCKSHSATCDGFYIDGACKNCAQHGLACVKHTEPVADCAPELLKGAPPQAYKSAPRSSRAGTSVQDDKGKRKATGSPDAGPNSKPVAKRAAAVRGEKRTVTGPGDKAGRLRSLNRSQFKSDEKFRGGQNVGGLQVQSHQESGYCAPTALPYRPANITQRMQQGQGLPLPLLPSEMLRLTPGQQYDGRDVVTLDQAMTRWPQNHNSAGRMQYIVGPDGEVLNQSMIDGDELLQKVHHQQARIEVWAAQYENALRVNHVPLPANPVHPPQSTRRTSFNNAHPPESRLNRFRPVQSANFKIYDEAARRNLRSKDFIASAPGSRMPSRQSSPQPSQLPRAPAHPQSSGQFPGMKSMPQNMEEPRSRELTQPIAMQRSTSFIVNENNPVMTLRIHSNTYDSNSTPIFSILTIRASQKFGPSLDAYCQQRNKQYGVDWVFIYRYALGGPEDGQRERYIKIYYDMTPNDVRDTERPEIKLRDMDTIMVMKAKSHNGAMVENSRNRIESPLSPIGSQVSEEVVEIVDGETPIYQNAGTIVSWHRLIETKLTELRGQITGLTSENQAQKTIIAQQTQMLNDLVRRNNELMQGMYNRAAGRAGQARPSAAELAAILGARSQRGPAVQYNPFVERLESVREPTRHISSQKPIQQYRFPTSSNGMQGRRPTHDSGALEAFPNFQNNSAPTFQRAPLTTYGMGSSRAFHVSVPQHMRRNGGGDGGGAGASVGKVEDVEMGE